MVKIIIFIFTAAVKITILISTAAVKIRIVEFTAAVKITIVGFTAGYALVLPLVSFVVINKPCVLLLDDYHKTLCGM